MAISTPADPRPHLPAVEVAVVKLATGTARRFRGGSAAVLANQQIGGPRRMSSSEIIALLLWARRSRAASANLPS